MSITTALHISINYLKNCHIKFKLKQFKGAVASPFINSISALKQDRKVLENKVLYWSYYFVMLNNALHLRRYNEMFTIY